MKIRELPNLSLINEKKLQQCGIETAEDLQAIGSRGAFMLVREIIDPKACLHLLYALEGGIQGINKKELSMAKKLELKEFYTSL